MPEALRVDDAQMVGEKLLVMSRRMCDGGAETRSRHSRISPVNNPGISELKVAMHEKVESLT